MPQRLGHWENAEQGIIFEVRYDDRDVTDTPDGLCYQVKLWHIKAVNLMGAGFITDDNKQIIVMRGDSRYDHMRKVYIKQL